MKIMFDIRFCRGLCYIFCLIVVSVVESCCQRDKTEPLKIGTGVVDITPPPGYHHYSGGQSLSVRDPLNAKAIVFKQGSVQGAILICDLLIMPRDLSRIVREKVSRQTGIPFQNISIIANHTHSSPNHDTISDGVRRYEAVPPSSQGEPWMLPVEIQVFRLDKETAIVTMPGELFVTLGIDLKKRSPFDNTMVIELANAAISYVPAKRAFTEGDYEPLNSRLTPGSG